MVKFLYHPGWLVRQLKNRVKVTTVDGAHLFFAKDLARALKRIAAATNAKAEDLEVVY